MRDDAVILIAEDDDGHYSLMEKNLLRTGISNRIIRFTDGQQTYDFLQQLKDPSFPDSTRPYLLILDIRMPKIDGMELLDLLKADPVLKIIPVIMLTTAHSPELIVKCRMCGCNMFVIKPTEYEQFVQSVDRLGHFLSIIEVPTVLSS